MITSKIKKTGLKSASVNARLSLISQTTYRPYLNQQEINQKALHNHLLKKAWKLAKLNKVMKMFIENCNKRDIGQENLIRACKVLVGKVSIKTTKI